MLRHATVIGLMLAVTGSGIAYSSQRTAPYHRAYCSVYEHRDLQGARMRIANEDAITMASREVADTYWRERPDWNDQISSIHLDPGCALRVSEHLDGQGETRTWQARRTAGLNVWYVGDRWNDEISSATCMCSP